MKFNSTGTLSHWQLDDIQVIEPLHSKANGGLRGGAYLCLPNFEALSPPFSVKHGEYRITPCDSQLPHRKNLKSDTGHNWGQIDVVTYWQEIKAIHCQTLTVTTTLRALSDAAWVRPGFHPYFSVPENAVIAIGATQVAVAALPHDSMQVYPTTSLAGTAQLTTDSYSASIRCDVSPHTAGLALAFVVWSDKKDQYVCIEPVIGIQTAQNNLPAPFTLIKNEKLVLTFTIAATKTVPVMLA